MRWLIIEDALRDQKGHWFEHIRTFYDELRSLGDDVTILADREIDPSIRARVDADPVLPPSIWHRMNEGNVLQRALRLPRHALGMCAAISNRFKRHDAYDIIFVPTVALHHLIAWRWLLSTALRKSKTRLLLYFLHVPLIPAEDDIGWRVSDGLSSRLWLFFARTFRREAASGRVVFGVETQALKQAIEQVAGVRVTYLPQPVQRIHYVRSEEVPIRMSSFGEARWEKGSDVLQQALRLFLDSDLDSQIHFTLQWINDFYDEQGNLVSLHPELARSPRVEVIRHFFADGEYVTHLQQAAAILLPYRRRAYRLRGSRVMIDALVNGIPTIATAGTTLAEDAAQFGATIAVPEGDVVELVAAIRTMELNLEEYRDSARKTASAAAELFSVRNFRNRLAGV